MRMSSLDLGDADVVTLRTKALADGCTRRLLNGGSSHGAGHGAVGTPLDQ